MASCSGNRSSAHKPFRHHKESGNSREGIAAKFLEISGCCAECLLGPFEVLVFAGIDANHLALLDEWRHHDHDAIGKFCRLG